MLLQASKGKAMLTSRGARLRHIRSGRSQAELAAATGVALRTWQHYERDERVPDADFLMRLAEMGVDVRWLVTGEGEPFTRTAQERVNAMVDADRVAIAGIDTLRKGAPPGAISQPARLDPVILRAAIEAIEEGLELTGRTASAAAKADLVAKAYDLFLEEEAGAGKATPAILRLLRTGT